MKKKCLLTHKHLLLTAYVNNPFLNSEDVELWLTDLVKLIDMEIAIPSKAVMVGDIGNAGPTGLVGLKTSHASIHVWTEKKSKDVGYLVQIDVYSCKDFDPQIVIQHTNKAMQVVDFAYQLVDRDPKSQFTVLENVTFNNIKK